MNVIVYNKQKDILDNANIDIIKDLTGLFNVDEVINNFKGYFFSKIIIDATSIVEFASENVLRKLATGFGPEKLIILLPPKPEPPQRFRDFLNSLGIYNYSTDINDIIRFLKVQNSDGTIEQESYNTNNFAVTNNENQVIENNVNENSNINNIVDINKDKKIVIGFKNVTMHAGSTSLIYMIKKQLENNYKVNVEAIEIATNDFKFFNSNNMYEVEKNNLQMAIDNSKCNIILVDLSYCDINNLCDDVIYLIEPSILKINKLLNEKRDIMTFLNNKKVVLNKSMLTNEEVSIFANEAGIKIYYSIPYVNDRIDNKIISDFIEKMEIVNKNGQGLLGLFNKEN